MDKLSQNGKLVLWGVVAIVIVAAIIMYGGKAGPNQGAGTPNQSGTPSGGNSVGVEPINTGGSGASGNQSGGISPGGTTKTGGTPKVMPITFITPVPGETWKISTQNVISWTREAGIPGQIEFLNAATMKLVGVILPETGPHQTSYTWNTRDVLLSRTNPLKTTVTPGRYVVKIAFDGNVPSLTSQPINLE